MRSRRLPHVLAALAVSAVCAVVAGAQPGVTPAPAPSQDTGDEPPPTAAVTAEEPIAVKPSPNAVPDHVPGPAKLAVTPFENHVPSGKSLDWIVAEAPFEIAAKSENVLDLEAVNAPLYVPGERVPAEPDTVADFAKKTGAQFVITGWFDRIREDLRLVILIWKWDPKTPSAAKVVGEAQRTGPVPAYHKTLGDALAEAWTEAGVAVSEVRVEQLRRPLARDIYPVFMMGRGLGHFSGALAAMSSVFGTGILPGSAAAPPGPDLKAAEHDLERAVFLDPKLFEAQRMLGELYMATAAGDPKRIAKATGKFSYAADLAPDDAPSLRAAAFAMAGVGKHEVALDLFRKLVTRRPWDLEARYRLGVSMWETGDAQAAERQLAQVTAKQPDHLPARRVLVLIHSAKNDTPRLIRELEAIAARAPADLDVKSDLATAYAATMQWPKAIGALQQIEKQRPDVAVLVRLGDAHRKHGALDQALAVYQRASRASDVTLPGFAAAQALFDSGRYADAIKAYQLLQRTSERGAAEHALGVIAYVQNRSDEAAWYLRQAARNAPRNLSTRRALIASELIRKDAMAARVQLEHALVTWPKDATLRYFSGLAHLLAGDDARARTELTAALAAAPGMPGPTAALAAVNARTPVTVDYKPELVRPWGDGEALQAAIERYASTAAAMAKTRADYQSQVLGLLGVLGQGPLAKVKQGTVKTCPVSQIAKPWQAAQQSLQQYARLGQELETTYRFIARHDEVGMTAALLPNARTAVAGAKKGYRTSLADMAELRSEWTRGLQPELKVAGCTEKLIQAAIIDPLRYKVVIDDKPEPTATRQPPRPKPRSTFFIDNTRCSDPVDVWIDGSHIGQVAPGRRSALVADGGERSLCLILPGGAQCGDRGTVRQVYLHDGWSSTMYCPN